MSVSHQNIFSSHLYPAMKDWGVEVLLLMSFRGCPPRSPVRLRLYLIFVGYQMDEDRMVGIIDQHTIWLLFITTLHTIIIHSTNATRWYKRMSNAQIITFETAGS